MTKESLKYPKDGLFRYRVGLLSEEGQHAEIDFACRWSPAKVDTIEVGMAAAAQMSYLSKKKQLPTTCERVA